MKLSNIYFKEESFPNIILSRDSKEENILSTISMELLSSIFSGNNTVLLSQGPLNMTALLASIYSLQNEQDVVVFLPKGNFERTYRRYSKDFFSLLYSTRNNPNSSSYFYQKILLCQGRLSKDLELSDLEIESKPVHGDIEFRRRYREFILNNCKTGTLTTTREIVFVPMERSLPPHIFGHKKIIFEGYNDSLRFEPGFFIFESMNEMYYNFELIQNLVERFNALKARYLFHFSWPYLRGLNRFLTLSKAQDTENKMEVFHLGKRLCLELGKEFVKPPSHALNISLEGRLWDRQYYPPDRLANTYVLSPAMDTLPTSIQQMEDAESESDEYIYQINRLLDKMQVSSFVDSLLRFPPSLDSFVLPSEIKDYDRHLTRFAPIEEIIIRKLDGDNNITRLLRSIHNNVEKQRDLMYQLNGLETMNRVTKRTLLQMNLLKAIQVSLSDILNETNLKEELIIANLHPGLNSSGGIRNILNYSLKSITLLSDELKFPSVSQRGDSIVLIDHMNIPICRLWQKGETLVPDAQLIMSKMGYIHNTYPIKVNTRQLETGIEIKISLDLSTRYYEFDATNMQNPYPRKWDGIDLCVIRINTSGEWEHLVFDGLQYENAVFGRTLSFTSNWRYRSNEKDTHVNKVLKIHHQSLNSLRYLPIETVQNSVLMIPGPIPFTSASNERLFLSEGYDILLMSFKRIVFFAYTGRNLKYLNNQLRIYGELFSNELTDIARKDLIFSCRNTPPNLVQFCKFAFLVSDDKTESSTFDDLMRKEILNEERIPKEDQEYMKKIKEIVASTANTIEDQEYEERQSLQTHYDEYVDVELVELEVKFQTGLTEKIYFETGTILRKSVKNEFLLVSVNEIELGDEILYISKGKRQKSIDDFLLGAFMEERRITLKQIFEPFTCLKQFCSFMQDIESNVKELPGSLENMYWLSNDEKKIILQLIRLLLRNDTKLIGDYFLPNAKNIWKRFITAKELVTIFNTRIRKGKITYENIYDIAKMAGLKLMISTFKAYCNFDINKDKHYFFRDNSDLLAIARLVGNQNIMDNYEILNEKGREIGIFLQMTGRCISRVISGKIDPLNEMDIIIEDSIQKCKVLSIH
jgi:hypothetical protein